MMKLRSHDWRRLRSAGGAVGLLSLGCISTELDPRPPSPISCADTIDESVARDAIVLIRTQLGAPGQYYCSGVVIAPRLVVTGLTCVAGLNEPGSSDPRDPEPPSVYPAVIDYDAVCDRGMDWSALEDGSFEAPIGRRLDPRAVTVNAGTSVDDAGEEAPAYPVESLFSSGATTSCKDSLAVLVLQAPLTLAPVPVRLDETSEVQEPVLMSGFCADPSGPVVPDATPATVEGITLDEATLEAPPRSLVLSKQMSVFAYGGGVFASHTGALIAVIASGYPAGCGGSEGISFASRVAAFRRLLIDAARDSDQPLHTELRAGAGGSDALPRCDSPAIDTSE